MATKNVKTYAVIHNPNGTSRINLYFDDNSTAAPYIDIDPARTLLLLDILRNEKPIFWSDSSQRLWTGREFVGEGEM